jgi:Bacterial Ig-like domain
MKLRADRIVGIFLIVTSMVLGGCGGGNGGGGGSATDAIVSIDPTNEATDVAVTKAIAVTFNADLDQETIIPANVTLTRANGVVNVPGAIAYDAATRTLTFTPTFPLVAGALYTFTITTAVHTKATPSDFTSTFTTRATPLIYVSNADPSDPSIPGALFNIWSINPDGTGATALTSLTAENATEFGPHWSPAYTQISSLLVPAGLTEPKNLFVMNADGSGLRNLTDEDADFHSSLPQWLPDGSALLFLFDKGSDAFDIGSTSPAATGYLNLTHVPSGESVFFFAFAQVTSDGKKVLYARGNTTTGPVDLHLMNTNGSGDTALTDVGTGNAVFTAAISPDGKQIFYSAGAIGSIATFNIYAINIDGTGLKALTDVPANNAALIRGISPDGIRIAYSVQDTTTHFSDLHLMSADGTEATKVTSASGTQQVTAVAWSPNSSQLAYTFGGDPIDLCVVKRDGTGNVNLTKYPAGTSASDPLGLFFFPGHWSTDGTEIAFTRKDTAPTTVFNIDLAKADNSGIAHVTNSTAVSSVLGDWW